MKKTGFIILIWLITLFSFLAEKVYLHDHVRYDKFKQYSQKAGNLFLDAASKLSGMIAAGQYNYMMWSEGLLTDELDQIKSLHPLIKDVLVFSADYHLLTGTNDGFSDAAILPWLEDAGNRLEAVNFIARDGYFQIYPVINGDKKTIKGFIVAVLRFPIFLKEGAVFTLDLTKSNLYVTPGYLSDADQIDLQKKLVRASLGESGRQNLKVARDREILWSYFEPLNIYFGYISDKPEIFKFVWFYITLGALILSILLVLKSAEKKAPKLEVYEQVLQDNIKTLTEMKKGMDILLKEAPAEKIADVKMVREISAEIAEEGPEEYGEWPRPSSIEYRISDFILIDPLDTKWFKPIKKKSSGESRRLPVGKEAFSEELMNLMKEVTRSPVAPEPEKSEDLEAPVESEVMGDYRIIRKDPLTHALEKLYGVEDVGEELEIAVEYARSYGRADGIAALFFDRGAGCYAISLANGLEMSWSRYFYLLPNDSVLPVNDDYPLNMVVSEAELENPYFRKRIPPDFLGRLGGIKIMPVSTGDVLIRVALFYFRDGDFFQKNQSDPMEALKAIDTPGFARYFQEIMPALTRVYFEKQNERLNPEESYRDIYNILKSFTLVSEKQATVLHAISEAPMDKTFRESLVENCRKVLTGYERYIVNNPNHLIFLLNETAPERIEELIGELGGSFEFSVMTYPELGKNLFAYL